MSLQDAKLLTTPNAYKAGKLYSIKPLDGSGDFTASRATTATRVNENGLIESVAVNVPRIDYTNGNCPSILVEEQATNLLTYSEEFDNAIWNKLGIGTGVAPIVTANDAISPNGTNNADKIVFDLGGGTTTSDQSSINQQLTLSTVDYSSSIYLKGDVGGEVLLFRSVTGGYEQITLTKEWQRFVLNQTYVSGVRVFELVLRGGIVSDGINNTATIYAWGGQLEEGTEASSYIPTTSSQVTRNADVLSTTVPAGVTEIVEELEDGTTNTITNIPATYTPDPNRYKYILMK